MPPDTTPDDQRADDAIEATLPEMLAAARWFGGKGAAIVDVRLHDRLRLDDATGLELLLADVRAAGRPSPDRYVVAGSAADTAVARWLAGAVDASGAVTRTGRSGRLVLHVLPVGPGGTIAEHAGRFGDPPGVGPAGDRERVVPLGGDASNSSFLVPSRGTGLSVKLLRRCRAGTQPEVEIGEFLARESTWHETPRLRGWLEYVEERPAPAAPTSTAIATVHEFAPGCTTAWDRLGALLMNAGSAAAVIDPLLQIVARIGGATARMHAALSSRQEVAAFAPRPATVAGRRAIADGMTAHARAVFERIEREAGRQVPAIATRLRALCAQRTRLIDRFARLRDLPVTAADIRVHGDYHLGQVLVGQADERVFVIDFEGEPGRPLEERRAVGSAAKDVAGMCRSFDYLVRQAAKGGGPPHDPATVARLERCFLDAYRAAAAGAAWWPATAAEAAGLLAAFRLDKAVYELAYELDNRPDWIDVPLAAVEQAAASAPEDNPEDNPAHAPDDETPPPVPRS